MSLLVTRELSDLFKAEIMEVPLSFERSIHTYHAIQMCSMVKIFQYCFIQASSGTLKLVTVIVDIVYKFDSHLSTALDSLASSTAFILTKHDIEKFALS